MADQITSLGFAPNLVPLVKKGTKQLTYRIGNKWNFLSTGDTIAVKDSSTDQIFGNVVITEKSYTTFKDLPINRNGHEIYESKEKQRETFTKYYGHVEDSTPVVILGFKLLNNK